MDAFNALAYKKQKGDFNSKDEDFLVELLQARQPSHLLDVGCGDGLLTKQIKAAIPTTSVVAIDNSPEQIKLATETQVSGIQFICKDIVDFTSDEKFDAIYSFYAFPHMPKSTLFAALKSVRQSLKESSPFYLFTNISLFETQNIPIEDQEATDIVFLDNFVSQINLTSLNEIQELFSQTGFMELSNRRLETGAKVKEYGDMISWQFTLI